MILEMLVLAELAEEGEKDVEGLDNGLIILQFVHGDVAHGADDLRVVCNVHVDFWAWERRLLEGCFHLGWPFLHERLDIWHVLSVVNSGGRPCLVQVLHTADPTRNFPRFLVGAFDCIDINGGGTRNIFTLHILQLQNSLVFVVQTWLVEDCNTEVFFLSIWLWHLEEGVNLAHCGNVVRDEGLDLRVKLNLLRLVALNVLKHLLEFLRHG